MMASNGLVEDDIISVLFLATADVTSTFPQRPSGIGFGAVPLLCAARVRDVPSGKPLCIRVLLRPYDQIARRDQARLPPGAHGLHTDDLPG